MPVRYSTGKQYSLFRGTPLEAVFLDEGVELLGTARTVWIRDRLRRRTVLAVYPVEDRREDLDRTRERTAKISFRSAGLCTR